MKKPPHPGQVVRNQCLEPLNLTVTKGAESLGVSRKALSELINGHSGISPEMSIRLSKAFDSSAEMWLRMQMNFDLAQAKGRESEG